MKEVVSVDAEIVYHIWAVVKPDSKVHCSWVQKEYERHSPQIDSVFEDRSVCLRFSSTGKLESGEILQRLRDLNIEATAEPSLYMRTRFTDGEESYSSPRLVFIDRRKAKLFAKDERTTFEVDDTSTNVEYKVLTAPSSVDAIHADDAKCTARRLNEMGIRAEPVKVPYSNVKLGDGWTRKTYGDAVKIDGTPLGEFE